MDHNECSSVWKTDGFLAASCRITGTSGLEYILTRKCPLSLGGLLPRPIGRLLGGGGGIVWAYRHPLPALPGRFALHTGRIQA